MELSSEITEMPSSNDVEDDADDDDPPLCVSTELDPVAGSSSIVGNNRDGRPNFRKRPLPSDKTPRICTESVL